MPLFTAGYEGESLEEFMTKLAGAGVRCLIDIRYNPISRKKGFSKTALSEACALNGIQYRHFRELGVPTERRRLLYSSGDYQSFFDWYRGHASKLDGSISQVSRLLEERSSCLLCFEENPKECHRHVLAEMLSDEQSVQVIHL